MHKKRSMTREDAQALLDTFRLERKEPPPSDPERVARRYVQIVCPDRLTYEKGPAREERG